MVTGDKSKKICVEIAGFPGSDMPWLLEKSAAIDAEMAERLSGVFRWHAVVPYPECEGFRIYFEIDPERERPTDDVPETLVAIVRQIACDELPTVSPVIQSQDVKGERQGTQEPGR